MRRTLKLFCQLRKYALFHFWEEPNRILIKADRNHYIAPEGRRVIHPHVLVNESQIKRELGGPSIYEMFVTQKGEHDDR